MKHQKISKFYNHECLQNFLLLFMPSLTAEIVKNSHILAGIYFIFLKNDLDKTFKESLLIPNQTSVKRSEEQLSSRTKFNTFWGLSFSIFRLKLCSVTLESPKLLNKLSLKGPGRVRSKNLFVEATIDKIFEANSSFHEKQRTKGKVQFLFVKSFLVVLTKSSF